MTTITTARQIFYNYLKLPVDAPMPEYVSLGDYEALRTAAKEMKNEAQNVLNENEMLLTLLRQWAEIGSFLQTRTSMAHADKLDQLRIDTKAALDVQPGNNPGTLDRAD